MKQKGSNALFLHLLLAFNSKVCYNSAYAISIGAINEFLSQNNEQARSLSTDS